MKFLLNLIVFLFIISQNVKAVSLPSFFGSGMVLQQNAKVKIWGWGKPLEKITLVTSWDEEKYTLEVAPSGKWEISFFTPVQGGPYKIDIQGNNKILLDDIYLGEVWLISGQSNMEWTPNMGIDSAQKEIAKASYNRIRFFKTELVGAEHPQQNVGGKWTTCTPETMADFSAVGYYFARKLQENLDVPIGIINSSWGGTPADTWTPAESIAADPILLKNNALKKQEPWGPKEPGKLYNGMIAPFAGYKIKGFLWYQGESNVDFPFDYDRLFSTMILSWRKAWGEELPFYFVQIAPFTYADDKGVALRNAQRKVEQTIPNTGMVEISDIGDSKDIHPKNKKEVGYRLANLALKYTYDFFEKIKVGPKLLSYETKGNKLLLYLNTSEIDCNKKCRENFEIADISGSFIKADVSIKSNVISLSHKNVGTPIFGRFEWKNTAEASLFSTSGLPISAFITDNWLDFNRK